MTVMMLGYGFGLAGLLWMLGGLLVTVGIVVLIVWAITGLARSQRAPGPTTAGPAGPTPAASPLDILRERFARGEISQEEFEQAKKVLGY